MAADEPLSNKITSVLKASIHCEGCKRKVKKILTQIQGVDFVDVDTKQQKVTVVGTVDAGTLIKKLLKSGKQAQLWPQSNNHKQKEIAEKSEQKLNSKSKSEKDAVPEPDKPPVAEISAAAATVVANEAPEKTTPVEIKETKPETGEKKDEEGCGDTAETVTAKSDGGVAESGNSGKKKKKKVQSGNNTSVKGSENQIRISPQAPEPVSNHSPPRHQSIPQQSQPVANQIPPHHQSLPQQPQPAANQIPPRHQSLPQQPQPVANHSPPRHHSFPPHPHPAYVVSFNTSYPTSAYTASYYAPPQPYSYTYGYMNRGEGIEVPPSDIESNPRQSLDSFEMFSDENPNGCYVM